LPSKVSKKKTEKSLRKTCDLSMFVDKTPNSYASKIPRWDLEIREKEENII
jgi:hypothetical protein